ncbi:class I adenylate-forming enzyme family protein [Mesorhizobium sp. ZC-5]|uniref:class I adenylate-forming enzyme family protein n=1 Tax=Mesorhizobium sp. ZC-5 TaxID=2986066 RepID=UPI0021E81644|nr:class I adenylate-forming enzyme family protein [Mesorhizobium sp. ZC-5]MCV3241755.1 acyl--CoA ligase [Mesorhizobium sp. ZC-5]
MFTDFSNEEPAELAERLYTRRLPESVYEVLSDTARNYGDRPAWYFIDDGFGRNWREVLDLVDRAADALHSIGIRTGSHVAVMAWNIEEFPVTWLALAKLGATMVPVNARYTAREVSYVLETSKATHFVVEEQLLSIVQDADRPNVPDANMVVIGTAPAPFRSWLQIHREASQHAPTAAFDPDRLLNLQYTSGTTGFSKACMLSHRYWIILGLTSVEMFATKIERFYASLSFFYMVPQRILMNTMFAGGCIIFPRKPSAKRFMLDVANFDCEYCLPFISIAKEPARPEDSNHRMKVGSSGLGTLASGEQSAFQTRFNFLIQNFYGMTEIGGATMVPAHHVARTTDTGTIGLTMPFREVGVFDEDGNRVAQGEMGEICVKGPGLLQGYFDNPDATASSFREDWFRTGDLGRQDSDGYFYLVGRLKDMVRRGGENIAAREVETVLRMIPDILEVAIVPVPDDHTGEEVKAYIQLRDGVTPEQIGPELVLEHCKQNLAPFKVPRYIEYVTEFPLTDSNRVQKRKLIAAKPDLRHGSYDRLLVKWWS